MTYDSTLLLASFLTGLLGSLHCVGMCGSLQQLFLTWAQTQSPQNQSGLLSEYTIDSRQINGNLPNKLQGHSSLMGCVLSNPDSRAYYRAFVLYHAGRILGYLLLISLFSPLLLILSSSLSPALFAKAFRLFAGALMIYLGLLRFFPSLKVSSLERFAKRLWQRLRQYIHAFIPPQKTWHFLLLGGLWGWLPCGLVYSAAGMALSSGQVSTALILMLVFALATIPALLMVAIAQQTLRQAGKTYEKILAAALIALGIYTIIFLSGLFRTGHLSAMSNSGQHGVSHSPSVPMPQPAPSVPTSTPAQKHAH